MTTVTKLSKSSMNAETAAAVAQFLSPVVVDLVALGVDGKQAHWHVRGPGFIAVHELLDLIVAHAYEFADTAAERVVALGLPLDARIKTVGTSNTLPALSAGFQQVEPTIEHVVAAIDAALTTVRTAVDELDDLDTVSQDVAIEIARGLEKDRWLLFAHIATK